MLIIGWLFDNPSGMGELLIYLNISNSYFKDILYG